MGSSEDNSSESSRNAVVEDSDEQSLSKSTLLDTPQAQKGFKKPTVWHMMAPMFIFTFSFAIYNPSLMLLLIERACEDLQSKECEEASVTGYTAKWMTYAATANSIVPAFIAGTIGILSDRYGRRLSLIMPAIGNALQAMLTLAFAYYHLPFWFIIVPGAVSGFFGGSGTMFCGMFAYAADVSGIKDRTLRFAWLAAMQYFGITLGNLAITPLVHFGGSIKVVFWPVAIGYVILAIYVCFVPESLPKHKRVSKLKWYKVNVFGALSGLWRSSSLGSPIALASLAATFSFSYSAFIGFVMILVLSAKQLYNWDYDIISYFAACQSSARGLSVLLLAPLLFHKYGGARAAAWIVLIALFVQTLAYLNYAVAPTTLIMFLGTILEGLSAISLPTIRAIFSKATPIDEQGKVMSALSAIEVILNVVIPILIPLIFNQTNVACPRCTLYVIVGLSGTSVLCSLLFLQVGKASTVLPLPQTVADKQNSFKQASTSSSPHGPLLDSKQTCPYNPQTASYYGSINESTTPIDTTQKLN